MRFLKFSILSLGFVIFLSEAMPAMAQDATKCVRLGSGSRSATLTNVCNRQLEVIWCHFSNQRKHKDGVCGRKGKYYQKHRVLKPGEKTENQYSLPSGVRIKYGACFGKYFSAKQTTNGRFRCK